MKKKIFLGVAAAILLGLVAFAISPISGDMFAAIGGGGCKRWVHGDPGAGVMDLNCRKALVFYNTGACSGKCMAIPSLPTYARESLEDFAEGYGLEIVSFVYIRMLDEAGDPADNAITVCFLPSAVDDVVNARIYVYDHHTGWHSYFSPRDEFGNICSTEIGETSYALLGRLP